MTGTFRTILIALLAAIYIPLARAAEHVDLLLVLASDVSRSVDAKKFQLQREGYAAAMIDPKVINSITSGEHGRIVVAFVEWSGIGEHKVVIDWTVISNADSARRFSDQLAKAPRSFGERTSISGGIDFSVSLVERAPFKAARRTIDVSGDGTNNSGRDVIKARDEAVAKGITINGLVILTEQSMSRKTSEHTDPAGGLANYYGNSVIGGPGAFVLVAESFNSFGQALINKLIAEIAELPPLHPPANAVN